MSVVSEAAAERRFRRLAGLPREVDPRLSWWRRKTVGPQLWVVLAATVVFAIGLTWQYREVSRSVMAEIKAYTEQIGNPTELTISQFNEALHGAMFNFSAQLHPFQLHPGALWTVTFYVLVFLLLDRWRPTTPSMKYVALGWGAACATLIALYVNTWASDLSNVIGPVDPTSSARAAIFIAPFVEEACKATVVFLLAVAVRYRLVSSLQMVALAGLSGVGFAFTENLIYYVRQYVYAVKIFGNDPVADLNQLMWLRGVATSFGHPLFTSMTAVGVIVALHSASRVVRIVAPLVGYLVAATLHMTFNGFSSASSDPSIVIVGGLMLVILGLAWLWRQSARQRTLISWRLDDYVRMGWLKPSDPRIFDRLTVRFKLAFAALLRGPRVYKATVTLIADITELAYLRAAMVDALVDAPGLVRERELLIDIRALRGLALDDPAGLRVKPDTWHPITRLKTWWGVSRPRWWPAREAAPGYVSPAPLPSGVYAATPSGWPPAPAAPRPPAPVGVAPAAPPYGGPPRRV